MPHVERHTVSVEALGEDGTSITILTGALPRNDEGPIAYGAHCRPSPAIVITWFAHLDASAFSTAGPLRGYGFAGPYDWNFW